MNNDLACINGYVTDMTDHLRVSDDAKKTVSRLRTSWTIVHLTITDRVLDGASLRADLEAQHIQAGWLVTTDAVFYCEAGDWHRRGGSDAAPMAVDTMPTTRILDADLALDDTTGLRVTHLGGDRWRVETLTERDDDAFTHLATEDSHFSLRKGRTMRFMVYWRDLPVEGDAGLTCYQPVAARFLGFGKRGDPA